MTQRQNAAVRALKEALYTHEKRRERHERAEASATRASDRSDAAAQLLEQAREEVSNCRTELDKSLMEDMA